MLFTPQLENCKNFLSSNSLAKPRELCYLTLTSLPHGYSPNAGLIQGDSVKSPRSVSSTFSMPQRNAGRRQTYFKCCSIVTYVSWPLCHPVPANPFRSNSPICTKTLLGRGYILGAWLLCSPKLCTLSHRHPLPTTTSTITQSSEAKPNLTANSQDQDESPWPEVRASQAQHSKLEDCVSFKHQIKSMAKPQENT